MGTEVKVGRCHCGAVAFEVTVPAPLTDVWRCNCSLCRRKGTLLTSVPLDGLRLVQGADTLSLYQWNTGAAEHYFCRVCGIHTHHRRRSRPDRYGINVACLDGVDPLAFEHVGLADGASLSPRSPEPPDAAD